MHDFQEQCQSVLHAMLCLSMFSSKYNKTIIRFEFCDIRNNHAKSRWVLSASASGSADNTYLDLDYSRYHKNLIQ